MEIINIIYDYKKTPKKALIIKLSKNQKKHKFH
jgi:hypothetical protein